LSREEISVEIIERCINNDRKAQELLYKQFLGPFWAITMRYLGNEHEAMEVLQDGYLKIFQNLSRFDPSKSSLYTWMTRIIINASIDAIRKKQTLKFIPCQELESESELYINDIPDDYSANDLVLLINQLPQTTKLVFNLYIIEGYTHDEIATFLKISSSTSRWHLAEAKKRLRDLIKKNG
jgi:RNA polymerase sigma-70 factor (ECF subfamily)